jgi:hypothetical protein
VLYAKRFASVLDTGDATPLLNLPGTRSREIALVALANLAKFQGRYERFLELKRRYDLKWSTSNSTQYFERFFNEELTLDVMLQRIKEMIRLLPPSMGNIVKFACLVVLRASEVIESVRLLNNFSAAEKYFNPNRQCLEHFRFPEIFIRQTKKAYISFITKEQLSAIGILGCKTLPTTTLNAITLACRRKGIKMEMFLCRKIFASHLIQSGIDYNTVDLLSGRVPPSVLARHYQSPSNDLRNRVLSAVEGLQRAIE